MTNEEMQRTMQFILQQQAQFATDMQQLKEAQVLTDQRFTHLSNVIIALAEAQARSEEKIASLAESQERLAESQERLAEAQRRTEEKLGETDERLNSLITVVERYISERRNGKSEDQGS